MLRGTVLCALILAPALAWAGAKSAPTFFAVSFDLPNRTARGSVGATRNTTDNVAYIGCNVSSSPYGICYAMRQNRAPISDGAARIRAPASRGAWRRRWPAPRS